MSIMFIMLNLTVALLPIIQLSYTHDYLFWGDLPWLRVLRFMLPGAPSTAVMRICGLFLYMLVLG